MSGALRRAGGRAAVLQLKERAEGENADFFFSSNLHRELEMKWIALGLEADRLRLVPAARAYEVHDARGGL